MTLQELWRGIWSEWLSVAFPLKRIIPLTLFIIFFYFLGDYGYEAVQESKEVVIEIVDETSHKFETLLGDDVKVPSIEEVSLHGIGLDNHRVLRI